MVQNGCLKIKRCNAFKPVEFAISSQSSFFNYDFVVAVVVFGDYSVSLVTTFHWSLHKKATALKKTRNNVLIPLCSSWIVDRGENYFS